MREFPKGVYPVMLTPFTEDNRVDYKSLEKLVEWYIENKVAGLFADCQSSEMFFLSLEERVDLAEYIVKKVDKRVSVVASGHISDNIEDQIEELSEMSRTGIDALILLTNRLAREEESDEVWLSNLEKIMKAIPDDMPLGFYECPYPYKRIISPECLQWCVDSKRFYFIKDTSCSIENMKKKLQIIKGSTINLFNANTSTLLETMEMGAAGFSGVMANFHPDLYVWLMENYKKDKERARKVADFLTVASLIERQAYPVNAKWYQKKIGNFTSIMTRAKSPELLNETAVMEMEQFDRLTKEIRKMYLGDQEEIKCKRY